MCVTASAVAHPVPPYLEREKEEGREERRKKRGRRKRADGNCEVAAVCDLPVVLKLG